MSNMQPLPPKTNNRFLFWCILLMIIFISCYFLIRAPFSFILVAPALIITVLSSESTSPGTIATPIALFIVCGISLIIVNLNSPIFGERYEEKVRRNAIQQAARDERYAIEDNENMIISSAEIEIERLLKDPDSATYSNERVSNKSGVQVACGYVSSRNSLGGMIKQRYVSTGIAKGTFLEEEVGDFQTVWNKFCY